jgi:hypothetical protein
VIDRVLVGEEDAHPRPERSVEAPAAEREQAPCTEPWRLSAQLRAA